MKTKQDSFREDLLEKIYDLVFYSEKQSIPGLLLLIDFEKAFDSLAWDFISVYNTCTLLSNNVKYVDANLDAPDNAGNEPSSEMLTSQSQIPE